MVSIAEVHSMNMNYTVSCHSHKGVLQLIDIVICFSFVLNPSRPIDKYLSYYDCLEDKSEDYQNCSVLHCVLYCVHNCT